MAWQASYSSGIERCWSLCMVLTVPRRLLAASAHIVRRWLNSISLAFAALVWEHLSLPDVLLHQRESSDRPHLQWVVLVSSLPGTSSLTRTHHWIVRKGLLILVHTMFLSHLQVVCECLQRADCVMCCTNQGEFWFGGVVYLCPR